MSLPNTAPSRNSGKNCARKRAALPMKICVQLASSGSPAERCGDQRRDRRQQQDAPAAKGEPDEKTRARRGCREAPSRRAPFSTRPAAHRDRRSSACRHRRRARREIRPRRGAPRRAASPRSSHSALSFEEAPSSSSMSVMIRCVRICAQRAPSPCPGIGDLAQQRDHAQFLHQRRIEGNLVEPIEDLGRRARRVRPLARIDLDQDGVVGVAFADQRRDGRDCRR